MLPIQRRNKLHITVAISFVFILSACGFGNDSSPPPPGASLLSIVITPKDSSVPLFSKVPLTATGKYSDTSIRDITTSVTWASATTAIAKFDKVAGVVTSGTTATANQTAVITATIGSVQDSSTITIVAKTKTFDLSNASDPLILEQWGLRNTGQTGYSDTTGLANTNGTSGSDINANPVYATYGYTGKDVTVAVVDSGLEIAHEDLSENVVVGGSWNFINGSTDPTNTAVTNGDHGTMVSGIIAMARNGKGGIGVASDARLKGYNLLGGGDTSAANKIISLGGTDANPNSKDVAVFNQSFGTGNPIDFLVTPTVEDQYAYGTSTLRGGKGALYVKSAGNGFTRFYQVTDNVNYYQADGCNLSGGANTIGISCQNANFDPYNTLPYNIVMAALNAKGKKSSYSTAGSAIWASAPGGESGLNFDALSSAGYIAPAKGSAIYDPAIVTTDQSGCAKGESVSTKPTGYGPFSFFNWGGQYAEGVNTNCNYTNGMNGTSSAAPMMTGTIALILESNPALTWREVKDILAKTAVQIDPGIAAINTSLGTGGNYVAEQGWVTNAAGHAFHNWYGFGAINASAAVLMARGYALGSLGVFVNTGWITGTLPTSVIVPDNSTVGVSIPLVVPTMGNGAANIVEAVQIQLATSATGGYPADLGIELISPSGTKSILKNIRDGLSGGALAVNANTKEVTYRGGSLSGMVLASNAFYGEKGSGTWTIKVVDGWAGHGNQTITDAKIRVYGH